MKKITMQAFLLMTLLALFSNAYSQQKTTATPEEKANKWTEWMKNNLQLTDDQVPKVEAINLKYATKMRELKNDTTQTKKEKQDVGKQDESAMDAEFKAVLTDAQYTSYQAKKSDMNKQIKEKHTGGKDSTQSKQ